MTPTHAIPCPPATARHGWTLYDQAGTVIGWVRRCEDSETRGPAGFFFTIPREGAGDPACYVSVRHAAQSPFLP